MNIEEEIKNYPRYLYDYIVNIYLVYKGARKTALLETSNIVNVSKHAEKDMAKMLELCTKVGLTATLENEEYKRYLVGTVDTIKSYIDKTQDKSPREKEIILGKYLGFLCTEQDYSNVSVDRIATAIYISYRNLTSTIVFVCEKNKINKKILDNYLAEKIALFSSVLPPSFKVTGRITFNDSIQTRITALEKSDIKYILAHRFDYINDLYNSM